jgi:putative SOS response-associated peptidase YedK
MCGRINVHSGALTLLFMDMLGQGYAGEDRYNVAPTETVDVIRRGADGALEAVPMRWWLTPYWTKEPSTKYSMFNAKAENLRESRAFREPFARRRCAVPISGFYEWARAGAQKQAWYVHDADDRGLLLAGIWDRWRRPEGDLLSFAVVTTAVHEKLAFVHNRQPALLSREEARRWLDPATADVELDRLLASHLPHSLEAVPVTSYVNNTRNQGPRCLERAGEARRLEVDR